MPRQLPSLLGTICALALAGSAIGATATPSNVLLATSKGNHTLAIVDPSSDKVIAKMPIGPDPHEVIVSEDGRTAYVSNMGRDSSLHRIDVLDLRAQRALEPIDTGALTGLHGLAVSAGKLWFTAQGAMAVARLDAPSRRVDWIMGTGQPWTHMIVLTPDLQHLYTSNVRAGSVSLFDLQPALGPPGPGASASPARTEWVHTVVPTEKGTEGIDLSPDGRELWTASSGSGRIYVIDTAARRVAQVLDAQAVGANRVKFTHNGSRVLITSLRTGDVFVYDAKARTEVKRLHVGSGCAGVLVAPDDQRAYVACSSDNSVVVLGMRDLKPIDHIDVGPQPDGLAWASLH
jgi:YVTN family beta-propeller protein